MSITILLLIGVVVFVASAMIGINAVNALIAIITSSSSIRNH